jgi:hypothetical protein
MAMGQKEGDDVQALVAEPMQLEGEQVAAGDDDDGGGDDGARKRQRLAGLAAPDAIMEPHVLDQVAAYLEAGGKPAEVVEALSDGYVGAFAVSIRR